MRNKWTNDEIDFIRNNYTIMSDNEISQILNTHTSVAVACKRKKMGLIRPKLKHSFDDVKKLFENTDYELISDSSDFKDTATNSIRYICPSHREKGVQFISLGHLKCGRGCYWCGRARTESVHRDALTAKKIECDIDMCISKGFEYVETKIANGRANIGFICNSHRDVGVQYMTRSNMNRDNIIGCRYCIDKKKYRYSKGELAIQSYLNNNGIDYISQYVFGDCKDITYLPFDFYLPNYNIIIEYDGQHHYMPVSFNGISTEDAVANHELTVKHDNIKDNYCEEHLIKIIRIPYWDIKNIESILDKELHKK